VKRILIVDDEEDIGTLMGGIFRSEGYEVDCAMTAEQALAFLKNNSYGTVFLDINLGSSDGLDLVPAINARLPDERVVVVSAYGDRAVREAVETAGIIHFVLKPFSKLQVLNSLEK